MPNEWRHWWIDAIVDCVPVFHGVTLDFLGVNHWWFHKTIFSVFNKQELVCKTFDLSIVSLLIIILVNF